MCRRKAESDEEKCRDPFEIFGMGGAIFPDGDGDSYLSLCRAKPDSAADIETLFKNGEPGFDHRQCRQVRLAEASYPRHGFRGRDCHRTPCAERFA